MIIAYNTSHNYTSQQRRDNIFKPILQPLYSGLIDAIKASSSFLVVNDFIDEDFDDCMQELLKNASNKGKEWLHPFVDEEGNFDYLRIPAEEVIPIYDSTKKRSLLYAIRYYDIKNIDDELKQILTLLGGNIKGQLLHQEINSFENYFKEHPKKN